MLNLLATLVAATAMQAAPAAPSHTLQTLPGTQVQYYDVAGHTGDQIEKALNATLKAQPTTAGQLYTWTVSAEVNRRTEGDKCTVTAAKAVLNAHVYLPRLAEEAKVEKEDLDQWKSYESGLEKSATDNLGFVVDSLPAIEQKLVGKPCDQAAGVWQAELKTLKEQQQAFNREQSKGNENLARH
jgi:predicted secreted Zn-dependent protease